MQANHRLHDRTLIGVEITALDQVIGKRSTLIERPRLEGGNKLALIDEAVLEGEQTEEQVIGSSGRGHESWSAHFGPGAP